MRNRIGLLVIVICIAFSVVIGRNLIVQAQTDVTATPSPYGTLLDTEIRGMSPDTIEAYRLGSGNGIALPAELNGYPGPRHVLDLADELNLTDYQREQTQALYDEMQPEAVRIGEAILAGEAALELAFRDQTIDEASLEIQLADLGALEAELRFVHLRTHLAMLDILTPEQIEQYNVLRGYQASESGGHQGHHGG
jgi:Spy/CpxP family protein refolding chaperone